MLQWDTAWRALRDGAGLHGLRFHDLRHTVITELAEMGVADHVLESISGHLSRRMGAPPTPGENLTIARKPLKLRDTPISF